MIPVAPERILQGTIVEIRMHGGNIRCITVIKDSTRYRIKGENIRVELG